MKKTIILDVDGVLLDFYASFLSFHNHKHGTSFVPEDLFHYSICEELHIDPQIIADFHKEEECAHLPLMETDIPSVIRHLREAGYVIVLNTDFPPELETIRIANLKEHGIEYDAIHFRSKQRIPTLYENIVTVVEDCPRHIGFYADHDLNVYVPHRPYLREECLIYWNVFRYFSLNELKHIL